MKSKALSGLRPQESRPKQGGTEWYAGCCERTEGHEGLALHAAQDLLKTAFIVEFPGQNYGRVSQRRRGVANEAQWVGTQRRGRDLGGGEAHSFSSKDEGSGRPDTGLVMMERSAGECAATWRR